MILSKKSINWHKKPPFFNKKIYFEVAKLIPKFATETSVWFFESSDFPLDHIKKIKMKSKNHELQKKNKQ